MNSINLNILEKNDQHHLIDEDTLKINQRISEVFKDKIENVLLIQPPHFPEEMLDVKIAQNKRYYNYPPYGLGLLSTNLISRGYKVHILDLNMELLRFIQNADEEKISIPLVREFWKKEVEKTINEFDADIVGLSCMFTMCQPNAKDVSVHLKKINPDIPIIAGGVHVTNAPEIFLREIPEVDFISLFESDISLGGFIDYVNGKLETNYLFQLGSIVDKKYFEIKKRHIPNAVDIDALPNYGNLDIQNYYKQGEVGNFRYWIPKDAIVSSILSNRGCRARCTFCSVHHFNGHGVRVRTIDSVIDEIKRLKEDYGINHITWLDDDIFFDHKRTVNLYNEIVRKNLNITWDAMNGIIASAVAAHPETIHAAADSGCIAVNYGVESGNNEILRSVKKPSGLKHYLKVGEIMLKYPQIYSRAFIIIGFPNETFQQLLDTVNLCRDMNMDWYGIQKLSPLPSTELFTEMVDEDLIESDHIDLTTGSAFKIREAESQRVKEKRERIVASEFENYFKANLKKVPEKHELDDMWLIMDYEANYKKILKETNTMKLKKMNNLLYDVSYRMTVENPLSTLFLAIVQSKLGESEKAKKHYALSKKYLDKSKYWKKRFSVLHIDKVFKEWEQI